MHEILEAIRPMLTEAILAGIGIVIAWIGARVRAKMGIDIEAIYRDSLHQALRTGVERILTQVAQGAAVSTADARVNEVLAYVEASVPDALKALAPSRAHLEQMAAAKINEALARLTRDDLTAALRAAGAPAVDPRP